MMYVWKKRNIHLAGVILGSSIVIAGCSSSNTPEVNQSAPYGNLTTATLVSETLGYFLGSKSFGSTSLYQFNPTTGSVESAPVAGFEGIDIRTMALSPEGNLWVGIGDFSAPEIRIISPTNNSLVDTIATTKNPNQIVFSDQLIGSDCEYCAVIAGGSSDYSSSDISIADAQSPYGITEGYAAQALSDIAVATAGDSFYRIGRYQQDNLTKYSFDNPGLEEWQFSLNEQIGEESNPYDVLFVSETKAYILRYGASSIWIVNPTVLASDEENFKIGEIDLSAYDTDGKPQMSAGLIHNGKLYVVMQAMTASWIPGAAYMAVIDTETDTEIDVDAGALNGLALLAKNPYDIDVLGSHLYVTGAGKFASGDIEAEYTGGIEKISLTDYATTLLVDD